MRRVVLISGGEGVSQIGTGFIALRRTNADFIVTCAHIITAVGEKAIYADGRPAQLVYSGGDSGLDLAVLRAEPLPDSMVYEMDFATDGAEAEVVGFQNGPEPRLVSVPVRIAGMSEIGVQHTPALHVTVTTDQLIRHGQSGSPVVDSTSGKAVGIVVQAEHDGSRALALAPINLGRFWPYAIVGRQETPVPAAQPPGTLLDAREWMAALRRLRLVPDKMLRGDQLTATDEPFRTLESFIEHSLQAGIHTEIQTDNGRFSIESVEDARVVLITSVVRSENERRWLIKSTLYGNKEGNTLSRVAEAVWGRLLAGPDDIVCASLDELMSTWFRELAESSESQRKKRLFDFVSLLLDRVPQKPAAARHLAMILDNHEKELRKTARPGYLQGVKWLQGKATKVALHGVDDLPEFKPEIALIDRTSLCDYEFEAMVCPLTVLEYARLCRIAPDRIIDNPNLPYTFKFDSDLKGFAGLTDDVLSLIGLCETADYDDGMEWDVPTVCEWFSLADCVDQPYPWGHEPPTPQHANLNHERTKRRLHPVGTFPAGASRHGTLDCCGNAHEIARVTFRNYFPDDFRLMGGCFESDPRNASCQIVRPFIPRDRDTRRNVALRLIRYRKDVKPKRREALDRFAKSGHPVAPVVRQALQAQRYLHSHYFE